MPRKNISKRLRVVESAEAVFGDVVYAAGGEFGPRWQGDYQLVIIVSGSARIEVDGRERRVAAGEVACLLPGHRERFWWDAAGPTHHTWCAVGTALVEGEPELERALRAAPEVRREPVRLARLMELALAIGPGARGASAGLVTALARAALHAYAAADGEGPRGPVHEALGRVQDWLGEHLAEPVDLPGLAKVAGVSSAQLVRLCKRELGETPLRHVWRTRTARGVQLLRDTGLPVAEIAWRCGFATPFHFSRWVREAEGAGPRDVRRAAWGRGAG